MEIYISEKDIEENELLNADEYDIVITKYREDFWEEEVYPEIQSLEKHEAEVRNKVIDEVLEWASYKINDYDTSIPRLEMINSFIKKLNDMKGGSNE